MSIKDLTDAELNARVAVEVMRLPADQGDWSPATSIEAAWAVEEKVVEDYGEEYGDALDAIVRDDLEADIGDHYSDAVLTYRLAHATPRQRCLAALSTVSRPTNEKEGV